MVENLEEFKERLAKQIFGRSRKDPVCTSCGSGKVKRADFRDWVSWEEYGISGFCQKCQDKVWPPD